MKNKDIDKALEELVEKMEDLQERLKKQEKDIEVIKDLYNSLEDNWDDYK